ncbi:hypothetical protein BGZ74_004773 [Mortierella antarctica]|nr:hypothetical protein BGZ74_004773 [Mortierella antarctica]
MQFSKAIASAAAFLVFTLVQASPIPSPVDLEASEIMEVDKRALELNDWNCKPSAKHPRPVVFVHGLSANAWDTGYTSDPAWLSRVTARKSPLNRVPVIYGLDKMESSALQLSDFIDKDEWTLWTRIVDILDKFATIGSIQYGSTLLGPVPFLTSLKLYDPIKKVVDVACLSCFQFLWDSPFIRNLNAGGDTVPGIEYLMITSNPIIQDWCPLDIDGHIPQAFDPVVFTAIDNFFSNTKFKTPTCLDYLS